MEKGYTVYDGGTTHDFCDRNHSELMPCPKRVAEAITMQPGALGRLSQVDKNSMITEYIRSFNYLNLIEEELSDSPLFT